MATDTPRAPAQVVTVEMDLGTHWPTDGFGTVAALLAQLPDPASMERGTSIAIPALGRERAPRGLFLKIGRALGKMAGRPRARAALAVRCTALLARGFAEVSAAIDPQSNETVAWGKAP